MDFSNLVIGENVHKSKWMHLPRIVAIGHNKIYDIVDVCNELKLCGNALIICGPNTLDVAGILVKDLLEDNNIQSEIKTVDEASIEEVNNVKKIAKEINANFLIGVGGGKSIDIAKISSFELGKPFISIPTSASHDGIASSRSSLSREGEHVSIEANAPLAIIADTEIIYKAPYRLLAAGCGDLISNFTAVKDWQLANKLKNVEYSSYAAALSHMAAEIIVESASVIKQRLEESAWIVMKGLVSSSVAMSIAGSSYPASGSEHKFSHMLDKIAPKPALHGEQCGMGSIMMMYLHGGNWKLIRDALKTIGCPVSATEIEIDIEYIIDALINAHKIRPERYSILGNGITLDAAKKLVEITKVGE